MSAANHFISPHYRASKASPGTYEDWVDIYEDRTWGWHLQQADSLRAQGRDAAIAALHLAVAFIEPYEVYRTGKSSDGKSKHFFRAGFRRIFGNHKPALTPDQVDAVMDAMYQQVRCGLFHAAMTGTLVYLSDQPGIQCKIDAATNKVVGIILNPADFVEAIIAEFRSYVARLRDPSDPEYPQLRAAFEQAWHLVHKRP